MTNTNDNPNNLTVDSFNVPVDNGTFKQDMEELKEKAIASSESSSLTGMYSISGSAPDPESDDDVLQNAHQMGIAPDADFENPKELDIAKNIQDAEKSRIG